MKENLENLLNIMCSTGATYADIFKEESSSKSIILLDSKIDIINTEIVSGIGLRVCNGHNVFYSALNDFDNSLLEKEAEKLSANIN